MSNDFCRELKLADERAVTVLYHYENVRHDSIPVIDNVWDESMDEDVKLDSNEHSRLCGIIIATYMQRDLRP